MPLNPCFTPGQALTHVPTSPQALAAEAEGYTGADLAAVCREAALAALQEDIGAAAVAGRHFRAALELVAPSPPPPPALAAVYERYQRTGR